MTETITLIDDTGKEHEFEVEAFLDVEEERYAVLVPLSEEYENEAVIMRFGEDENGEEVLFDIESDEEYEAASDGFDEWLDSMEYDELVSAEEEE